MFRALFRLILFLILLVVVGGFFLGWWSNPETRPDRDAIATAGRTAAEQAKVVGAQISEKTAEATKGAREALGDGALTAKIKAKMTLDDSVKALNLSVSTTNGVATISGVARSNGERERALQLARETEGIHQVVDRIVIEARR